MALETKYDKWASLLLKGMADQFFQDYPEDEALASALNVFLQGAGTLSTEQLKNDRARFAAVPRLGAESRNQNASPTKSVILNKSKQLNVREALAEILDNIFDNFERNTSRPQKLKVEIFMHQSSAGIPGEIRIVENSGGIPEERIGPLIQLGVSDPTVGGIGAWGEGFKMAAFALGEEVQVFSTYPSKEPVGIIFPKGWLDKDHHLWTQWRVNIHQIEASEPNPGSTVIRINYVRPDVLKELGILEGEDAGVSRNKLTEHVTYFGEIYSEKFHQLQARGFEVEIYLQIGTRSALVEFLQPVEDRLRANLAFLPWLLPIRWTTTWTVHLENEDRDANLKVTLFAGLAATDNYSATSSDSRQKPGVEMWGNGRKFSLKGRIADESVGWGHTFGGSAGRNPNSNASSRRITIVALFSADNTKDIPWAAPVKNDYNRRSEFYAEIKEAVAYIIRLYKDSASLLEFVLHLFSSRWSTYSEQEKLEMLFSESGMSVDEIAEFASSRFGKKVLGFDPSILFHSIDGGPANEINAYNLYGLPLTRVRDLTLATAATKDNVADRVHLLRAILPHLADQADLEERYNLAISVGDIE